MYYKPLELKLLSSKIQKENTSAQEKNKKKNSSMTIGDKLFALSI